MTLGAGILGFSLKGDLSQLPNNVSTGSYILLQSLTDGDQTKIADRPRQLDIKGLSGLHDPHGHFFSCIKKIFL